MSSSLADLQLETEGPPARVPVTATPVERIAIDSGSCPALLLELEDRLRPIGQPDELACVACGVVAGQLGVTRIMLLSLDDDGRGTPICAPEQMREEAADDVATFSLADFGTSAAQLAASRAVRVGDVRLDPRLASADVQGGWTARRVLALAAVPVVERGRAVGLLVATHAHTRVWDDAELQMLHHAASRIWRAFAQANAHRALERSEHEHRMAVELCSKAFWTTKPGCAVVDAGDGFGEPCLFSSDQQGLDSRHTIHPEDLPMVEEKTAHCLRTGENYDVEYRVCAEHGRTRWLHVQAKPMRERDGAFVRWFGTTTDISERKSIEAALKSSEERLVRALAGARVGTWELDIDSDAIEMSPSCAATFFGRPNESIRCSADFEALLHPGDLATRSAELARVVRQARVSGHADYQAEFRAILPNGDVRWLGSVGRYTAEPGTGRNARLSGVLVDMSERRRAELELNATQKRLQDLNADLEAQVLREVEAREQAQAQLAQSQRLEALGQLAGGIAHDFNNVLQAVMGGLELLERRADRPDQVRQLALRTNEAVARGIAITGRLLSFARRGELNAQRVDASSLLESLRDLLAPTLGGDIILQVASDPDVQAFVADRAQLETVLVNLAVNARHAMPDGGTLAIKARQTMVQAASPVQPGMPPGLQAGSYVHISVQDTGTGMSPDVLARACDPFFSTRPLGQGTGLGLAMARGFVEQSGGGLILASQPGQGTTVSLLLPAVHEPRTPESVIAPTEVTLAVRSPSVLMVDDDGFVRTTLAGLLVDLGCTVIEADNAAAALAYLRAGAPVDLVVTDYAMPGMNGVALAAVIRQNHTNLPLLLVTGNVDAPLRIDAVGWDPARIMVLRKPLSADALASAVNSLLSRAPPRPRDPAP